MLLARRELGDDALLLESRNSRIEESHQGEYALEFELPAGSGQSESVAPGLAQSGIASAAPSSLDMANLRRDVASLSDMVSRLATRASGLHLSPEFASAAGRLLTSGFPERLIHPVLDAVEHRLGRLSRAGSATDFAVQRALAVELDSRMAVSPATDSSKPGRQVIALVGPAGSGKTSTLVKLALQLGIAARSPTVILSTDSHRVAATEQLKAYAAILGVPFSLVSGPGALARALLEHRQKELILIDSPGFGGTDDELAEHCASLLSESAELDTHLVLSAASKFADCELAIGRWARFRPRKLILTHLDETESYGECLAAAMNSGLPVAFLCGGQRIPEDLEPATKARLLQMLLGAQAASFAAIA